MAYFEKHCIIHLLRNCEESSVGRIRSVGSTLQTPALEHRPKLAPLSWGSQKGPCRLLNYNQGKQKFFHAKAVT